MGSHCNSIECLLSLELSLPMKSLPIFCKIELCLNSKDCRMDDVLKKKEDTCRSDYQPLPKYEECVFEDEDDENKKIKPLVSITHDDVGIECLTTGHFLIGHPIQSLCEPPFEFCSTSPMYTKVVALSSISAPLYHSYSGAFSEV